MADPERPEPELSRDERKVERKRLRAVRNKRLTEKARSSKTNKKNKKGK
ncbi:MAG: hypothetical protein ABIW84_08755 [Ilumatobacteraceae bacterium]